MTEVMDLIIRVLKGSVYVNPKVLEKYKDDLMMYENEDLGKLSS